MNLKPLVDLFRAHTGQVITCDAAAQAIENFAAKQAANVPPELSQYMLGIAAGSTAHAKANTDAAIAQLDRELREFVLQELRNLRSELTPHLAQ